MNDISFALPQIQLLFIIVCAILGNKHIVTIEVVKRSSKYTYMYSK